MSIELEFQQYDATDPLHQQAAYAVAEWSRQEAMCELSIEKIASSRYSLMAFGEQAIPLGHIALFESGGNEATVGGFIVNPDFRGRGIGSALVRHFVSTVGEKSPDIKRYQTHTNYRTMKLFTAVGGTFMGHVQPTVHGGNWIVSLTKAVNDNA